MSLVYTDLHVHSHYSRATSPMMNLREISKFAKIKGLNIVGTGDFSHPLWISELESNLEENTQGIYEYGGMKFVLSNEISLIYTDNGKGRRVHNIILAPDLDAANKITEWLKSKGRVDYDGRPIFGFTCPELVENLIGIDERIEIIPAHIWTPHFGVLGASSGFNSIEECFGDQSKYIHALETGISSDPDMNRMVSSLDSYALVSFSDSHSVWPWRLGRESTVFDLKEITYDSVIQSIRRNTIKETIEFFPEGGKYHLDGHRKCNVRLNPSETRKNNNICPVCGKPITIGVLNRVEELADRPKGHNHEKYIPFKRLFPLTEIIAAIRNTKQLQSKKIWAEYNTLIKRFGSELNVLLNAEKDEIARTSDKKLSETITGIREGKLKVEPGYDGVYGTLSI